MKLTLVFNVFNKATTLESVLTSWINRLSFQRAYEVIVTCDACVDGTAEVARKVLQAYAGVLTGWQVVETPDIYEIAANNLALRLAAWDSDLILFIQDDNWMFSSKWDVALVEAQRLVARPGATALLAGGVFHADGIGYMRVECSGEHKGDHFDKHRIPKDKYPLAVYGVDFVTRPFAIHTTLLRDLGGLASPDYERLCFDDTDLSVKLLRQDYTNLYLPCDVLNTSMGQETMKEAMRYCFDHNQEVFRRIHQQWLQWRDGNTFKMVRPLTLNDGRLSFAEPVYDL